MNLVINTSTGAVIGTIEGSQETLPNVIYLDAPADFDIADAVEWNYDGAELVRDPLAALNRAKSARIIKIKKEAAQLITALDWKLERARERDVLELDSANTVDVLNQREAIRQASNRAEDAVNNLTDAQSVNAFSWSIE